jgi:protein farnesyltransferase subunit beta
MTITVKGGNHRGVIFKRRSMAAGSDASSSASSTLDRLLYGNQQTRQPGFVIEEQPKTGDEPESSFYGRTKLPARMAVVTSLARVVPDLFTSLPNIRDLLNTETSQVQDETVQECLPFLSGTQKWVNFNDHGVPHLDRKRHIQFLHKSLRKLPPGYVAADASRPWMFYWALAGLCTMGEDVSEYRERIITTVRPIQNAAGGFGGGNGQMSHLAPTYAIVLSLAMVGGREALDLIDRKAMWKWLGALKQADGGFQMSVGGEEDVR